jgi:hypothetical protein
MLPTPKLGSKGSETCEYGESTRKLGRVGPNQETPGHNDSAEGRSLGRGLRTTDSEFAKNVAITV